MANAHTTSPARPESDRFIPLGTDSQHHTHPRNATLYLRADAPADELYNAAEDRLSAVIDLLGILSLSTLDAQPMRNVLQISRSLLLLASDARSLYQAGHELLDNGR
ncbi:hypothetical protein JVX91_02285 [Pseudomonas sp. PDNC002]|nr:hypothetical protein JVX91_02285 [Pseudomonas sp. PDNC002]